jgi:hypothetical protein
VNALHIDPAGELTEFSGRGQAPPLLCSIIGTFAGNFRANAVPASMNMFSPGSIEKHDAERVHVT